MQLDLLVLTDTLLPFLSSASSTTQATFNITHRKGLQGCSVAFNTAKNVHAAARQYMLLQPQVRHGLSPAALYFAAVTACPDAAAATGCAHAQPPAWPQLCLHV